MSAYNNLDNRMKKYEASFSITLPPQFSYIIRVNSHCFSNIFSRKCCNEDISEMFKNVALQMSKDIQGCSMFYCIGDEMSFLISNNKTEYTQPWLGGDVNKIVSITSSMASSHMLNYIINNIPDSITDRLPIFSSKVFIIPDNFEIQNYVYWRKSLYSNNIEEEQKWIVIRTMMMIKEIEINAD
jgi:tRNA(His) 5'-end guanylyltransferase